MLIESTVVGLDQVLASELPVSVVIFVTHYSQLLWGQPSSVQNAGINLVFAFKHSQTTEQCSPRVMLLEESVFNIHWNQPRDGTNVMFSSAVVIPQLRTCDPEKHSLWVHVTASQVWQRCLQLRTVSGSSRCNVLQFLTHFICRLCITLTPGPIPMLYARQRHKNQDPHMHSSTCKFYRKFLIFLEDESMTSKEYNMALLSSDLLTALSLFTNITRQLHKTHTCNGTYWRCCVQFPACYKTRSKCLFWYLKHTINILLNNPKWCPPSGLFSSMSGKWPPLLISTDTYNHIISNSEHLLPVSISGHCLLLYHG